MPRFSLVLLCFGCIVNSIRKFDWLVLVILLLIAHLIFLDAYHLLAPDETRYVNIAWEMYAHHHWITPTIEGSPFLGKPILFYWLSIISFHVFGVGEFAARFFPAISGVMVSVFGYFWAKQHYDTKTAGWFCAWVLAVLPWPGFYRAFIKSYVIGILFFLSILFSIFFICLL